jgi:uncharacterized protein YcfJ
VAATIVGALAGGLLGSAAKEGSAVSTVGGAVVGGLMAHEGDKWYDRHDEKKSRNSDRGGRRGERADWY